ncbi:helix-turn-helix domain-containing protein [Halomarina rubra]|uniref:Helix-turn-helix domain-containing protein n=1 Tax=Halomarina rubra TaxID=2071873 RepID=A0ABD6AYB1_9EURY|nr:helix-turn-helix domain-containing protein [Halomarina rubra]
MAANCDPKNLDRAGTPGPERTLKSREVYDHMAESDPLVTAKGLADELGVCHATTRRRLEELAEHGYIGKRRLHAKTVAYWHPEALTTDV